MIKVTYDYVTKDGFLETKSVTFKEMKSAFSCMQNLSKSNTIVGKPILERVGN
jgi:hypothetical protein